MNTLKKTLLASAGLIILALTLVFTDTGRTVAQGIDAPCIRLCDDTPIPITARIPIPVTGEVAVRGEVNVITPSRERPLFVQVVGPLRSDIVQHEFEVFLTGPAGFMDPMVGTDSFTVPSDKVYVITQVSGTIEANISSVAASLVRLIANGVSWPVPTQTMAGSPGNYVVTIGSMMNLPVLPGSDLIVELTKKTSHNVRLKLSVSMQ